MPSPSPARETDSRRRIGILSTYPPKQCGLATFAAALERHLDLAGTKVEIVRIDDGDGTDADDREGGPVVAELVNGTPASIRTAAAALSRCDVAVIQHEYGIYGGPDGDEVLALLDAVNVPTIIVLHTVLTNPTPHQKFVLEAVASRADRLVVMSRTARKRLLSAYAIASWKVVTIPHGATAPTGQPLDVRPDSRFELLTWGLLGPGKGIEHAIAALALVDDLPRHVVYTVAGVTHPKVFARAGDEYRFSLIEQARALGLSGCVRFDDAYRDVAQLMSYVATSSVVVLPYDSRDQVTSGVLVDAIVAGRPVISTAFPHAEELLATGAGIVVPHEDPVALAAAIRAMTTDAALYASMAAEARRLAPTLEWSAVANQYSQLADVLVLAGEPIAI